MIELICLSTVTLDPINASTVIVNTQDPWVAFFSQIAAVFIGGVIALIANYALQMHGFDVENRANLMNQRRDAYSRLLYDIYAYEKSHKIMEDISFHIAQAALYGSPEVRRISESLLKEQDIRGVRRFWSLLNAMKIAIKVEIDEKAMPPKSWWQFWK